MIRPQLVTNKLVRHPFFAFRARNDCFGQGNVGSGKIPLAVQAGPSENHGSVVLFVSLGKFHELYSCVGTLAPWTPMCSDVVHVSFLFNLRHQTDRVRLYANEALK